MYDDSKICEISQIKTFLDAATVFGLEAHCSPTERGQWVYERLVRFKYQMLGKKEKGLVLAYLHTVTGLQDKQIDRNIVAYKQVKKIGRPYKRQVFPRTYTEADKELLAETDNAHGRLSGTATKGICARQTQAGDRRYERLAKISKTHLYRFRQAPRYRENAMTFEKTQSTQRAIGERRKPDPNGEPGYLRVDTVHQGDLGKEKGVYHVNLIDVITQWEVVLSVEQISEKFMKPVLEEALSLFPFVIKGFHSDNGSEYINDCVSRILRGLKIEQTKSRARKTNDNALIESKNGAIIRKWLGYWHIPGKYACRLNVFHRQHLIPYINFIRPCAFPEVEILPDGKRKVRYKEYTTPCEKLLSLPDVETFLKPGITKESLEKKLWEKLPNDAANEMQEAKRKLFSLIIPHYSATLHST
jgi:transposase InsO family protein